jgi:hypothetical protein
MSSGRYGDFDTASTTLAERLFLAEIRKGASINWQPEDPPVRCARAALEQLGFFPGSLRWHPPHPMRETELRAALWQFGLWQPPAEDWLEGLTARGWAALEIGRSRLVVERAVAEVIRRCLAVERLGREVLYYWLGRSGAPDVHRALWEVLPRRTAPIGEQIPLHGSDRTDDALLDAASFGHIVQLLQLATLGDLSRPLADRLWRLVDARNRAAHGRPPTLPQFVAIVDEGALATRELRRMLV